MAQTSFYQPAESFHHSFYNSTPSPQQSFLSSNIHPSQQLTPQTEYSDYGFQDAQISRSNSESFIFQSQQHPHIVPSIAPAVGAPQRLPISYSRASDDKPKNKRTPTACENCRTKKSKCDGGHPCLGCSEAKVECKYREVIPSKKENAMNEILELLTAQEKNLRDICDRMEDMDTRLRRVEHISEQRACWQCGTSQFPAVYQ